MLPTRQSATNLAALAKDLGTGSEQESVVLAMNYPAT